MSVTNYDGRLEQMATYAKSMYLNIAKLNNAYSEVSTNAYAVALTGTYADVFAITKMGGKTVVMNQHVVDGDFPNTDNWVVLNSTYYSLSVNEKTLTIEKLATGSGNANVNLQNNPVNNAISTHKYYMAATLSSSENIKARFYAGASFVQSDYLTTNPERNSKIVTATDNSEIKIYVAGSGLSVGSTFSISNFIVVDLTQMFGAGNEPSTTSEAEAILAADYYAYNEGTLLSAGVAEVISTDSSDNVLQTVKIPADIQALEGYGWSCPTAYNYIDLVNNKYVQAVGSRDYEAGDESDADLITDGATTYYELDEPVETTIEPIVQITKTETGGAITLANQHDGLHIPVPVDVEMIGVA